MWHNIPAELRTLPQWVVSGADKIPINPRTGQKASVTDPSTWATFTEVIHAGYKHIGFVLTESDPFAIIDLDNKPEKPLTPEQWKRHEKILAAFDSYTERSASGKGFHIVIRGRVPSGVHRDSVEVYSSSRYMICTGDVIKQLPINYYQTLLDQLYGEMKPIEQVELEDKESPVTDEELIEMAMRAENADKFTSLCNGEWQELGYPSQSEADFALLSIFTFYSPSNDQVRRLFRYSKLGQREKAQKDNVYLNACLRKIRAVQTPPAIDVSALKAQADKLVENFAEERDQTTPATVPTPPKKRRGRPPASYTTLPAVTVPPGIVGEMAKYFYSTAVRPVPEVALAAALGLTAGVCGRSYNISGTGLNQYIILLAKTGTGKEGAASGIDKLVNATRSQVPMVDTFIGPGAFASGQALVKVLDEQPCFLSVLGEFGLTLQQICDPRASSAEVMLRKVLLDLYLKSGWTNVLRPTRYSDKEKNTGVIQAPAVTILGESTQERFFDGLDSSHIAEGLIPRFCVVEYLGKRPPINEQANQPPPPDLVQKFIDLVVLCLATAQNGTNMVVGTDPQATALLKRFNHECDDRINNSDQAVDNELWSRAHLKALKLAALLAVGCNPHQPTVALEHAMWAIDFVKRDILAMSTRFAKGEIGFGDAKQLADVKKIIKEYYQAPYESLRSYDIDKKMWEDKVLPYVYLQRRTANLAAFRRDRRGASSALKSTLEELTKSGYLLEIPKPQVRSKYSSYMVLYAIAKAWNDDEISFDSPSGESLEGEVVEAKANNVVKMAKS